MDGCARHDSLEKDITRLRDDVAEIYTRMTSHETRLGELDLKDKVKEDSISKLEKLMEKGQARLEELIQKVANQVVILQELIQRMQVERGQKMVARWDDIVQKVIGWIVVAALGAAAAWLLKK
jgi:predicted  nucleic acid-binding Zn-ribbon protein